MGCSWLVGLWLLAKGIGEELLHNHSGHHRCSFSSPLPHGFAAAPDAKELPGGTNLPPGLPATNNGNEGLLNSDFKNTGTCRSR